MYDVNPLVAVVVRILAADTGNADPHSRAASDLDYIAAAAILCPVERLGDGLKA